MVEDGNCISTFAAVDCVPKHVALEPVSIIERDITTKGLVIIGRFYFTQILNLSLIELFRWLDDSFISIEHVELKSVRIRTGPGIIGTERQLEIFCPV